ncbi:hypothetical protein TBLA_0D04680 [Henningerozyma blattae CBS 6284]|uniref:AMP-activated protein kinase glycogen-binding domain-containing protein n=1 Tax=Henningerozyma blattae (strain ATCC 34711 / CBS 6284 / DSM 70876 / NBRC 10599 / NRRL Y-10934 / UCD 77-7) TaxID=1071380 RepID=I2H3L2_HENB6|nr:hypothetical protein TBLA_0D04680 [Tetrapisispora blattae CBS 6284]CCH60964.1 hypothetical protein TBLA_0D04680 [Tetrapisispora blattae CBS 6284]
MEKIQLKIPTEVFKCDLNDRIIITGEFDNWSGSKYILESKHNIPGAKVVEIPIIQGKESITFKFIINDSDWITLPYFKTVYDSSGFTNNILFYKDYPIVSKKEKKSNTQYPIQRTLSKENLSILEEITQSTVLKKKDKDQTSTRSASAITDYVNISSNSELSSTEELEYEGSEMDDQLEETLLVPLDPNSNPQNNNPDSNNDNEDYFKDIICNNDRDCPRTNINSLYGFIAITKRLGNNWNNYELGGGEVFQLNGYFFLSMYVLFCISFCFLHSLIFFSLISLIITLLIIRRFIYAYLYKICCIV